MRQTLKARRSTRLSAVVAFLAAFMLVSVPAAGTSGIENGLYAFVRADAPGPLPACSQDGSDCTPANVVWHFVYVANVNRLTEVGAGPRTRATLRNSLVVTSVDTTVFVDGTELPEFEFTTTPPPSAFPRTWSGHWPATVSCPPGTDPCNVVGSPAVVPGEVASVVFVGWQHGADEPNGTYVFRFDVIGTLNGEPVRVTAFSRPIEMTD